MVADNCRGYTAIMRWRRSLWLLVLWALAVPTACDRSSSTSTTVSPPRHSRVEVFVNNHALGDTHGCCAGFTPLAGRHEGPLTCGPTGAASKLTWQYLRTDQNGDHYRFEWSEIDSSGGPGTRVIETTYRGVEQTVFENDRQRVILRPWSE